MFLAKTMRYYRLWIYTCNAVLFLSVVLFTATAIFILTDNRRHLISSIQLYHPSFLYAYIAIPTQAGVVQIVGCVGALRLNKRLLKGYWIILLCLLVGDVVVGFIWLFRFDAISKGLENDLSHRLSTEYRHNIKGFRNLFDEFQQNGQCCGAHSPLDYNSSWWFEVSDKYVDEYETLANDSDSSIDSGYITKTPIKQPIFPSSIIEKHKKPHFHNIDNALKDQNVTILQRYDEENNITTTYVKKENGITSEYDTVGENGDQNNLGKAASTSNTFKSLVGPEWQNPNVITSDQAAQNGEKIKEEEEYDIDHDHLLLPWACCIPIVLDNFEAKQKAQITQQANIVEQPIALANTIQNRYKAKLEQERRELEEAEAKRKVDEEKKKKKRLLFRNFKKAEPVYSKGKWCTYTPIELPKEYTWHHKSGCKEPLTNWLNSNTDLLLVLGFCVIGFLKFIFISILHYEIREMIQKIHMLENETNQMNGGLAAVLGLGPEIRSVTSSDDPNDSRSSPSCHSSQSYHPPQTANTILSYPLHEKIPNFTSTEQTKEIVSMPKVDIGSNANNAVDKSLYQKQNVFGDATNANVIQMTAVTPQQLINTDTYCPPAIPPPPLNSNQSTNQRKECHSIMANMNAYPNRNLNLDTSELVSGNSMPHSHDLITSSTATTAQSSSESTINKPGEFVNRSSEASILSPQSEWPIRQQHYFTSEHHDLSNTKCEYKVDASSKVQTQELMKDDINTNKITHRRNENRNLVHLNDCAFGGGKTAPHCANPNSTLIDTEFIASDGSFFGGKNGGSSKQTAI